MKYNEGKIMKFKQVSFYEVRKALYLIDPISGEGIGEKKV